MWSSCFRGLNWFLRFASKGCLLLRRSRQARRGTIHRFRSKLCSIVNIDFRYTIGQVLAKSELLAQFSQVASPIVLVSSFGAGPTKEAFLVVVAKNLISASSSVASKLPIWIALMIEQIIMAHQVGPDHADGFPIAWASNKQVVDIGVELPPKM